jgi:rRNA maturation RNase YbeY
LAISFFSEDVKKPLYDEKLFSHGIDLIIKSYDKSVGEINYIFCSDNYLLDINRQYLDHDDLTDIITFDYTDDNSISGDIFISIDRVEENGNIFGDGFDKEFLRVISHGILHLIGFKDKTEEEKSEMRLAEDNCIMLIKKLEKGL